MSEEPTNENLVKRVRDLWESMVLTSTLGLNDRDNSRWQFDGALTTLSERLQEAERERDDEIEHRWRLEEEVQRLRDRV